METNKKLAKIIAERGIKQTFISERTGISLDAISRILRCERKVTADEFLKICKAIGISPEDFNETA